MKMQRLLSFTRKAIDEYHMIEENDRIAIGVSGGKDSLTLLAAMAQLRYYYPKKFSIIAVTVDLGFENMNLYKIRQYCEKLKVEYHVISTNVAKIVFDVRKEKNPCSLCAKMRKGAFNDYVKKLGCNKVAYAHHKDDLIETMMMSFLFEGRLYTFSPVTHWNRSGLTLIRPLLFLYEGDIKGFAEENELPIAKNPCPADGMTSRQYAKDLINQLNREHPGAKSKMFRAVINGLVNPNFFSDEKP